MDYKTSTDYAKLYDLIKTAHRPICIVRVYPEEHNVFKYTNEICTAYEKDGKIYFADYDWVFDYLKAGIEKDIFIAYCKAKHIEWLPFTNTSK